MGKLMGHHQSDKPSYQPTPFGQKEKYLDYGRRSKQLTIAPMTNYYPNHNNLSKISKNQNKGQQTKILTILRTMDHRPGYRALSRMMDNFGLKNGLYDGPPGP